MIFISHRGNLNGIISERENSPAYIDECLNSGFRCEIDLRIKGGIPHLGHDIADYPVSVDWLGKRRDKLWIHVKEYDALIWLMKNIPNSIFFCHESDRYTLVSNGFIWSHDLTNSMTARCVIPLLSKKSIENYGHTGAGAVCSDFIYDCIDKFEPSGESKQ